MSDIFTGCTSDYEALRELLHLNKTFYTSACFKIYRADIFRNIEFPKGVYYEDIATGYKIFSEARRIAFIDEPMYAYRVNMDGIMHDVYSPKILSCIEVARQLFNDITEKYPSLSQAAASITFNINRTVYLNLPHNRKDERRKVWAEVRKYRYAVLTDKHARKVERLVALASYSGPVIFRLLSGIFRLYHSIR